MKDIDVVVCGHLCLDLIPDVSNLTFEALAIPGRLHEIGSAQFSTGGAVSNTGLALHQLGVNVRLMANVGDDLMGRGIVEFLRGRDEHLTETLRILPGKSSSYTIVISPPGRDRSFLYSPGTNVNFGIADLDFELIEQARIFHLGYPSVLARMYADDGAELTAIFQRAREVGAITSLDTALPDPTRSGRADWRKILMNCLPCVDIFLPSIEEALYMLRRKDYEAWHGDILSHLTQEYLSRLADELLEMGVTAAGFKLGEMGMYLKTGPHNPWPGWENMELWQPAFQVEVVGTTGAGDAAYAGFLAAWLRGFGPVACLRAACACGACCAEATDAISGVLSWEETILRLETAWPTRAERLG